MTNEPDIDAEIREIGKKAREASSILLTAGTDIKNKALSAAAKSLRDNMNNILAANKEDMKAAKEKGISGAFLDRLILDDKRIESMASGLEDIAALPDPVGSELARWSRPNGLDIARVRVPLGVIGVIYESRPNVTADAGALCLKSGNAAILRGGSESFHSSKAIMNCLRAGLKSSGLPDACIQLIPTKDRAAVGEMLKLSEYIDVIVPRGGKGLIKRIMEESRIPTFQHLDGNCHTYIHKDADFKKAVDIVTNAKMRRVGICGATESLVVDADIAGDILPSIVDSLQEKKCEIRGDKQAIAIDSRIIKASEEDWSAEYLDAIISVKIVRGIDEALEFIRQYSSGHTDAIITENAEAAEQFFANMDSAIVMQNASTQFADGGEFGMGAEIGIATGRLHARGPVGLEQLTTFKYIVRSDCAIRP